MAAMHMQPAKSIVDLIGVETASKVTGKHVSRVYRWMYPSSRGGTGGIIPQRDALKLLEHSRANDLGLTEADFLQAPAPANCEEPN